MTEMVQNYRQRLTESMLHLQQLYTFTVLIILIKYLHIITMRYKLQQNRFHFFTYVVNIYLSFLENLNWESQPNS